MSGLYSQLLTNSSSLEKEVYTKSSMVALSHAMEDLVMEFNLTAEIFVLFQEFKFFLEERERYLKLDQVCKRIFVFVKGVDEEAIKEFENTEFIEIPAGDPLLKEWALVVNHPQQPMVLATKEEATLQSINQDSFRIFAGFLDFSNYTTLRAVNYFQKYLKQQGVDYQPYYQLTATEAPQQKALKQKLSLFINNSLNEIEKKVTALGNQNVLLSYLIEENKELTLEVIRRLCQAAEYRDEDSIWHLIKIGFISSTLLGEIEKDSQKIEEIYYASLMHDIGKIGIPDSILLKAGPLSKEEYQVIKEHPQIGAKILGDSKQEMLQTARKIAYNHHEKWDGSGYPSGKSKKEIPLSARIVAIADVFDALSSDRVYKEAYPIEKCVEIMKKERDQHFEGELVELFLNNLNKFLDFKEDLQKLAQERSKQEVSSLYFETMLKAAKPNCQDKE
ncbi:HD domain-containing phosphohydrolase [Fuchsiella alkaliacetigena]|uniref:HD domain-containing phosphohydrolase n=1 Tax=Fuchsiella alkaliacetigena TaxID=957042 RepID=UPI00200B0B85|nr:HD domain-containing phosphohydrolase [Fuchsiella alkaliacetigena]MCK8824646.1 HD domain-containing protein [Fuchsiella alkaliacetigena]